MPRYRCILASGNKVTVQADSLPAAILQAEKPDDPLTRIQEEPIAPPEIRVTEHELATFYRQLSSMLEAGMPLAEGLQIIARDTSNQCLKHVCYSIYLTLASGGSFSAALKQFPELFSGLHLALARAGEHAGLLPKTLKYAADYLENIGRLTRRFSTALVYPAIVGMAVIGLLMGYWGSGMIESIMEVYTDLEIGDVSSFPLMTRISMRVIRAASPTIIISLITILALVLLIRIYYRTRRGNYRLDRAKLWLPYIGQITHKSALARFCRTLALLLRCNVEIETSLQLAGEASGNAVMARAAKRAASDVMEGASLSAAFGASALFPHQIRENISTGEKGASLMQALDGLADFYGAQTEHLVRAFSAVIEPLLILILGFFVGTSIISLLLPLVQVVSGLSGY